MKGVGVAVNIGVSSVSGIIFTSVPLSGEATVTSVTPISGVGELVTVAVLNWLLISGCSRQLDKAKRINPLRSNRYRLMMIEIEVYRKQS